MFKKFTHCDIYNKIMGEFFRKMLSSSDDVSAKRVVGLLAFITIDIIAFCNLFLGKVVISYIFDGLVYICMTALGLTVLEKYSDSFNKNK